MSTSVEKIKERLGIEEVVSSYMKLDRAGKSLKGKCPFHNEKTPSFYVSPDRASFYCFGCGAKGDIFSFVQQFEGLDFMGSLKLLAERAGVDLAAERAAGAGGSAAYAEAKSEKERLYAVMEEAAAFFEKMLAFEGDNTVYAMAAREAREYVKSRGISDETARAFRLGFIPNDWRILYTYLREKKYNDADIEKAGLAKRPEAVDAGGTVQAQPKNLYDRFRGRVMFPIMDSSGRVIAFSGRILHDDGKSAKYLNSPDTPLYNKSTVLYGIDKAKQEIRTHNYTILVEGQMDLVLSHQAGIRNTVAVSGTALSDTLTNRENVVNNLGIVRRLSPNLILAFDSDAAGRKAAMRSAQIALSLGMDVKIAAMPEGKDPADMVRDNPESWKNVLRAAKPIVAFQLDGIVNQKLDIRKIPAAVRENVLPFVLAVDGAMERAQFVKLIHEQTGITMEAIQADLEALQKKLATEARASAKPGQAGQAPASGGIVSDTAQVTRLDMISRKLFGLLAYLTRETELHPGVDIEHVRASMKTIAGEDRYNNLIQSIEPFSDELVLEAEIFFGSEKNIQKHIDELLLNFEEDIIRQDFASTMAELTRLEKKKGDIAAEMAANQLMAKCNTLAVRLSEIAKRRQ